MSVRSRARRWRRPNGPPKPSGPKPKLHVGDPVHFMGLEHLVGERTEVHRGRVVQFAVGRGFVSLCGDPYLAAVVEVSVGDVSCGDCLRVWADGPSVARRTFRGFPGKGSKL